MKLSKYTKLFTEEKHFFVYNSLSNYFGEISQSLYQLLGKGKNDNNVFDAIEKGEFLDKLFEKKIITNSDEEDVLHFKSIIKNQRRMNNVLVITIAPTMDCNFSCPYCFENKKKGNMKDENIQRIVNFINSHNNIDTLNITWFGGEPLLAPHIIENISKQIDKQKFRNINASIITNGYFFTRENIELLKYCNVKQIQISIDGMSENHNKVKYTTTDKNTFATIIHNLDNFDKMSDTGMQICIRVNISKKNENDFLKVYDFFKKRYHHNNISIVPAFVMSTTKNHGEKSNLFISNMDKFLFCKKVFMRTHDIRLIFPCDDITECAVRNNNSWVFDAEGNVYKCWEVIGHQEYKVGEIRGNGEIYITNTTLLNKYLYGADPFEDSTCQNCFSLPICKGGCPHKRIENKFNNGHFFHCTPWHNQWENYLSLRYIFEQEFIE